MYALVVDGNTRGQKHFLAIVYEQTGCVRPSQLNHGLYASWRKFGLRSVAISSVQSQTFPEVEHIIQDGASSDQTLEIVNSLKTPNIFVESGKDAGLYDAINRGISWATGDIIGLMHSDDFFARDEVLSSVAKAFLDPIISGVYGDLHYISSIDETKTIRW